MEYDDVYIPKSGDIDTLFYKLFDFNDSWYYLIWDKQANRYTLREGDGVHIKNRGSGIGQVYVSATQKTLRWSE